MSDILGTVTTYPINDVRGNEVFPPIKYNVIEIARTTNGHTIYITDQFVTDYDGQDPKTGTPLMIVDIMAAAFEPA